MKNSRLRQVTGKASFVDDFSLPNMAYAGFVRSPYAHAKITKVDPSKIHEDEDFVVSLSNEEAKKLCGTFPVYLYSPGQVRAPERHCLAYDQVNFAGEAVFAFAVEKRYAVEDAIEKVKVDYEPLKPILDAEAAVKDGSVLVHDYLGTNSGIKFSIKGGDIKRAFGDSQFVIKRKFKMHRHSTSPMEPQAAIASYEQVSGKLTLIASTQLPFILKSHLSILIGIPENQIRVIAPDVGGGFGAKLQIAPEYVALCLLSMKCGRPIKWIETRTENLTSFVHGRDQIHEVEGAFSHDGRLLGIRDRAIVDAGAYIDSRLHGQALSSIANLGGPYKIEAIEADCIVTITNKCPYGPYRGFGAETGSFIVERLMNLAASRIGLDQVEIRKRNMIRLDEMPYTTCLGYEYDPTNYQEIMEKALSIAEYQKFAEAKKNGDHIGIGLAIVTEASSVNTYTGVADPDGVTSSIDFGSAHVRVDSTGRVVVLLGTVSLGTGHAEAVSVIMAEQIGVDRSDVEVLEGDTEQSPYDCGVRASRFSTIVLPAVLGAAKEVRRRIVKVAAGLLEANENDIVLSNRTVSVKGTPSISLDIRDVTRVFYANVDKLPEDMPPTLDVINSFKPKKKGPFNTFSHTVHVPVVRIDPETGQVRVLKYVIVEDCGNIVSKEMVDGQIYGGLAQVIGGVFFEESKYDEDGQLLTSSFVDYLLPTAKELTVDLKVDHTVTPSKFPGGFKGMGESSNVCGYAGLLNAVNDAIGETSAEINETGLSPERLWSSIHLKTKT